MGSGIDHANRKGALIGSSTGIPLLAERQSAAPTGALAQSSLAHPSMLQFICEAIVGHETSGHGARSRDFGN
jgi:hypothetical protein